MICDDRQPFFHFLHKYRLKLKTITLPLAIVAFLLLSTILSIFSYQKGETLYLIMSLRASAPGSVTLYYDLGGGFREEDKAVTQIRKDQSAVVCAFAVPNQNLFRFRFDPPATFEGTLSMGDIRIVNTRGKTLRQIHASHLKPLHQIRTFQHVGSEVILTVQDGADDPQVGIDLDSTFRPTWSILKDGLFLGLIAGEILLITLIYFLISYLWPRWRAHPKRRAIIVAFLFLYAGGLWVLSGKATTTYLKITMQSSSSGIAQLFFDTGSGYSEALSVRVNILGGTNFSDHLFLLPNKKFFRFRFDPLSSAGRFVIRQMEVVNGLEVSLHSLALSQVQPAHQILEYKLLDQGLRIVTEEPADDPQLIVNLQRPLLLNMKNPLLTPSFMVFLLILWILTLLCLIGSLWLWKNVKIFYHRFLQPKGFVFLQKSSQRVLNINTISKFDIWIGGTLVCVLAPFHYLLSLLRPVRKAQDLRRIVVIKMVGGGSLFLSLPSLLGLKKKYPQASIELVATPGAAKFAELMGIFDRIHVVKDSSAWFLVGTTFKAAQACWGADAVLNYEVYSQFSKLFVMFLCCRIRIGFHIGAVGHSAYIYTYSVYWNIAGCVVRFYEQAVKCLGAESCSDADAQRHFRQTVGLPQDRELRSDVKRIALGVGCSGYFPERMLSPEQWQNLIHVESGGADIVVVGGESDRLFAESIIALSSEREKSRLLNRCGETSLREAVKLIDACDEYWGIDSGLLHMSIGLGVPVKSFWGPSAPHTRLSGEMSKLGEFRYAQVPCSPCVHMVPMAPCRGNNQCIKALFPQLVVSTLPSYTPVHTVTDDVYTWMRHLWAHLKDKSFLWVLALLLCCVTAFLGYRTIPAGGISDRTSWLDYGSEQQAWGDARAISKGEHRWGIVQYAHYPNGPSYVLLPWMAITGRHDPDTMRMLPFWLALVAQYFLFGACIKAFRSRTLAALVILGIACMQIQPGMYEWMGALHQHSYVMTILLLMLGASLIMPRVGLLFCVAGLLAGWLGYDMLLLIMFSAGAIRFLYHATIAKSDRWIWRTACDIGFFMIGMVAAVGLHLVQNSLFFGSVKVAFLDLLGSAATRAGHEVGKEMNPAYYSWISGETNKSFASFGNAFPAMLRTWLDKPWAWPLITKTVLLATLLWTLGCIGVQRHRSWLKIVGLYALFVGILCIGAVAWPFVMPWHFVHHFHFIPRHYYGVAITFILGSIYLCDYSFSSQHAGVVPNKVSTGRLLGQSALVTLALLGFLISAIVRP